LMNKKNHHFRLQAQTQKVNSQSKIFKNCLTM
jgi:hypothetical protein